MLKLYSDGVKPELSDGFIEMLDNQYSYKLYVELVHQYIDHRAVGLPEAGSWTDILAEEIEFSVTA